MLSGTGIKTSSIGIYKYDEEIQYAFDEIRNKITSQSEHKYKIRKRDGESSPRQVTFIFTEIKHDNTILLYEVKSDRELPDGELQTTYHNICIGKNGYLVLTGMTDRVVLLRYFMKFLHPQLHTFQQRYFTKNEILEITDNLLAKDSGNVMYRPRFHFYEKYNGREFSDYSISETESATDDPQYELMKEKCQYLEPHFKMRKLNGEDFVTSMKINHVGLIYSSQRLKIDDWITFIKQRIPWCL